MKIKLYAMVYEEDNVLALTCDTKVRVKPVKDKDLMEFINGDDIKPTMLAFKGDWHKRPLEFLRILELNRDTAIPIIVETELSWQDFQQYIGIAMFNKTNFTRVKFHKNPMDNDPMLAFMGATLMTFYLEKAGVFYVRSKEGKGYRTAKILLDKTEDGEGFDGDVVE